LREKETCRYTCATGGSPGNFAHLGGTGIPTVHVMHGGFVPARGRTNNVRPVLVAYPGG
jgi:hypothetical protein